MTTPRPTSAWACLIKMAEIAEGFLCPLCKQDCQSVRELEAHYRNEHNENTPSKKLKKDFLSFIDKAVNTFKIDISPKQSRADRSRSLSQELESDDTVAEQITNVSGINTEYWDPQEVGRVTIHSIQFRRARDTYLAKMSVETNRVIIRLEKLFRLVRDKMPRTAKQMRSVEQDVVPWKSDKEAKQCGGCGGSYGVRKRKHHCRLCGDIRCNECCGFMTLLETYPLLEDCPDYKSLAPPPSPPKKKFQLSFKVKKQSSAQDDDEEGHVDEIRMCTTCKTLITRRLQHLQGMEKSELVALYDKMKLIMAETERLKPGFIQVAEAVWSGEQILTLKEASSKRQELLRLYEGVDSNSKRILSIGASDSSHRQQKISRNIRVYVSNYLQEHLLTLPALPTQTQLDNIKQQREQEAQQRLLEIERQREEQRRSEQRRVEQQQKVNPIFIPEADEKSYVEKFTADVDKFFSVETFKDLSKEIQSILPGTRSEVVKEEQIGGWMCDTDQVVRNGEGEEDPFAVQREQLLSYIAQAREANRTDEVYALELSLRDIEIAMQEKQMSHGFRNT